MAASKHRKTWAPAACAAVGAVGALGVIVLAIFAFFAFARVAHATPYYNLGAFWKAGCPKPGLASANGCTAQTFDGYTVGWVFTTASPLTITQLGWFDQGGDGLNSAHTVAIFTSGGAVLTSTIVSAGTGNPLVAGYRYAPIAPYALPAGTYVLGGTSGTSDPFLDFCSGTSMASGVSYVQGRYINGSQLQYPSTAADRGISYFGPNFQFSASCGP